MSKKEEEIVAVMLPRDEVLAMGEDGFQAEYLESSFQDACKRALRPEPPNTGQLRALEKLHPGSARFILYVLEHGWEPDHD